MSAVVERLTSAAATRAFGRRLARTLRAGDVVSLEGPLGAGKTTLLQGLAAALGIKQQLTSPTFILFRTVRLPKVVRGIRWLVHADAYRVSHAREFTQAGFGDFVGASDTLTVVEWGDRIGKLLPRGAVRIKLRHVGQARSVTHSLPNMTRKPKRASKPVWRPRSRSVQRARGS